MLEQKPKSPPRPGEIFFAVLIVAFSAIALWQAYRISGFSGLATPGVFPMLAAAAMLISAVFILFDAVSRRRANVGTGHPPAKILTLRLLVVVGLVTAYVLAMPYVGFMVGSALFLFATFAYLWRKNLVISAILTAGTLAVIYVIFRVLFQVVLPRGTLWQGLL